MNSSKLDPEIIASKVAALPGFPMLAKELSALIPTIVQEQTGQFAAALAHEVRNPLTNINLSTEMLKLSGMTEEQKIYLDIILRGTARINDLVTDFLTSYQPDSKQLEEHNIHELLDDVLRSTKDRILLKNIRVNKSYTTINCKVLVNKAKLKIALTNIVINAIDAMEPGRGILTLVTRNINGKCELEIQDNGIGISKDNLEHIFKPYYTNKPGGLGLGLSTTLDTLLLNHAKLVVKSSLGKGTTFIVSFEKFVEMIPV